MKILLLILVALVSAGCSFYWTRPNGTLKDFAADHRECIRAGAAPVPNESDRVVPNEAAYRRCLIARGWSRRQARTDDVPGNYYRGYEEREVEPVWADELPQQPASATYRRNYNLLR